MSAEVISRSMEILLVEDSPDDIELTKEALSEGKVWHNLHVARDGAEAMQFLKHEGKHAKAPRPDLVFLDLNLPKKDGREILDEVKSDPNLKEIPIVVLTTSETTEDIVSSYARHANAYVAKPVDMERFIEVIQKIEDFWLTVVNCQGEARGGSRPSRDIACRRPSRRGPSNQ